VLSQVLASAVEGGRLTRDVAAGIKLPKVQRAEMHFLDAEQVETLADVIDPRYGVLIRSVANSGMRPSELTALRVGRLEQARMAALAKRERTQRGPAVVKLAETAGR
jgi:integrase